MQEGIDKKSLILSGVFSVIVIVCIFYFQYFDTHTKIIFCDVGQGDGTYIRIHNQIDVLIDAGPDKKILSCLGKYMPFYDRTIEYVVISHPQKDHYGGLIQLVDRYHIQNIIHSSINSSNTSYKELLSKLKSLHVKTIIGKAGLQIQIKNTILQFIWPNDNNIQFFDDNDLSLITLFQEREFRALFTGDVSLKVLTQLSNQSIRKVTILKIPHHGSKHGLIPKFLELADPIISVISVGKNNIYGHPSKEVIDMLKATNTKIRRTDKEGNIVFKLK